MGRVSHEVWTWFQLGCGPGLSLKCESDVSMDSELAEDVDLMFTLGLAIC